MAMDVAQITACGAIVVAPGTPALLDVSAIFGVAWGFYNLLAHMIGLFKPEYIDKVEFSTLFGIFASPTNKIEEAINNFFNEMLWKNHDKIMNVVKSIEEFEQLLIYGLKNYIPCQNSYYLFIKYSLRHLF